MKSYVHGDSLTLQEFRDANSGLRPSYEALLSLIDTEDPSWPLVAEVLREMADAGVEINETAFAIAAKMGARRFSQLDARVERSRRPAFETLGLATASASIVYYVQRGDVIKIGTTTVPKMRFEALMPDEILAFEPGTIKQEKARHRQFAHLRCQGEHFRIAPELLEHARHLRSLHGDPDPSWPTVATLRRERASRPLLPAPSDGPKVTAAEAAEQLGIKRDRVYGWAYRQLISPVGCDEHGVKLFCLEQVKALLDHMTRRAQQPACLTPTTHVNISA